MAADDDFGGGFIDYAEAIHEYVSLAARTRNLEAFAFIVAEIDAMEAEWREETAYVEGIEPAGAA